MRPASVLSVTCLGASVLVSAAASAAEAVPVRLEYRVPPACPDSAAFFAAVRARTVRVRAAREGEAARTFVVVILSDGERTVGRLQVNEAGSETDSREVSGASCAEVVEALSLTAALSVDPEALLAPPVVDLPPAPPPKPKPVEPPLVPPPKPAALRWWLGADLLASTVVRPFVLWGAGLGLGLEQATPGLLRPSVRVTLRHARNDVVASPDQALATWSTLGIDACPLRLGSEVSVAPCILARTGLLRLRGEAVDHPRSVIRPWWSLGGAIRARISLGSSVAVEMAGSVEAPIVERRFVLLEPRREVAHTPPAAVTGSIGLAAQLR